MPLVSVIIPIYNTEKFLPLCINSVLNQTLTDIEVLLVNDGSIVWTEAGKYVTNTPARTNEYR